MGVDKVPPEILTETLSFLGEDVESLVACTVVSRLWSEIARPLRFRRVSIDTERELQSAAAGEETARMTAMIAPWIRDLRVRTKGMEAASTTAHGIFEPLAKSGKIESFVLKREGDIDTGLAAQFTETTLYRILFLPTITQLDVEGIPVSKNALACHPRLQSLSLAENCSSIPNENYEDVFMAGTYTFDPRAETEGGGGVVVSLTASIVGRERRFSHLVGMNGWALRKLTL